MILSSGKAVLEWLTDWPTSVVWHDRGMESVEKIHGHNGSTKIVFLDPPGGVVNVSRRLSDDEYEDIKRRWKELHAPHLLMHDEDRRADG